MQWASAAAPADSTLALPSLPPYSRTPSLPNTFLETKCNNVRCTVNVATLLADGCSKLLNNTAEESVGMSLPPVLGCGWLYPGLLNRHHVLSPYKGSLNCEGYIAPNWNCRGLGLLQYRHWGRVSEALYCSGPGFEPCTCSAVSLTVSMLLVILIAVL